MNARPRYATIFEALKGRIAEGRYALGASLPTEAALCAEFSASRFTVREALRLLVETGQVGRRRGSGTYVISREPRAAYVQSMRSLSELFQYARDTEFDIISEAPVALDAETADILRSRAGALWLRVDGVRWTKGRGETICFTRVHVDARFAPLLPDIPRLDAPIYATVEARSGEAIAFAEQEIRAAPMPDEQRRLLECSPGTQALLLTRRYINGAGETMVCSMNWHPAERFRYTMRMQRDAG